MVKLQLFDTIEFDVKHFCVGLTKIGTFQSNILTANVERFTLFTFANCIVHLAFNHAIMIFPSNVWNHLQMHRF